MVYLDASAGSQPYPEVIETVKDTLTKYWVNASANNSLGHESRVVIDKVTNFVANDINCNPENIIWTSGACEANSLAIMGLLNINSHMHFYTTHLEHTSINEIVKSNDRNPIGFISNDKRGFVDISNLEDAMRWNYSHHIKTLVSISFANSELGVIQDIKAISEVVHKYDGILHTDATQVYPWMKIDVRDLGIDLMSISGQKLRCVKGVGFLYVKDGIKLKPLIYGSQQEGRRGGTYPTHLIAAFGKALELIRKDNLDEVERLRNMLLERLLQVEGVRLNGPGVGPSRLINNISLTVDNCSAEKLVTLCDILDVIIGKGSACKSYEPTPSKTLLSIGLTEEQALNTIRITLDTSIKESDLLYAADVISKLIISKNKTKGEM